MKRYKIKTKKKNNDENKINQDVLDELKYFT